MIAWYFQEGQTPREWDIFKKSDVFILLNFLLYAYLKLFKVAALNHVTNKMAIEEIVLMLRTSYLHRRNEDEKDTSFECHILAQFCNYATQTVLTILIKYRISS